MPTAILPSVSPAASSCFYHLAAEDDAGVVLVLANPGGQRRLQPGDVGPDEGDSRVDRLLDRRDPLVAREGDDGDAVESSLDGGLEERLVGRRIESGVPEDFKL